MISRRWFIFTAAILPALALTTQTSHAQQSSTPSAAQLYVRMTAAMQGAESVHIRVHTANLPTGPHQTVRETFTGSIDISSTQHVLHAVYAMTYANPRTNALVIRDRARYVAVDGRFAQRESSVPWSCQRVSSLDQLYSLTSLSNLPVTPQFLSGVTSATALGTAIWRVTIDLGNRTDVLNIAQDSYRLVRITEVRGVPTAANGVLKTYSDFSRYGESVSAQLPAVCR